MVSPAMTLCDSPLLFPTGQIDVMVFYSISALTALGGITPQQMETIILESLTGTNQAMVNSEVSVYINPVHVGLVRFEVSCIILLNDAVKDARASFRTQYIHGMAARLVLDVKTAAIELVGSARSP